MFNKPSVSAELNSVCALILKLHIAIRAVDLSDFRFSFHSSSSISYDAAMKSELFLDCAELAEFFADAAANALRMVDIRLAVLHGDCRTAEL